VSWVLTSGNYVQGAGLVTIARGFDNVVKADGIGVNSFFISANFFSMHGEMHLCIFKHNRTGFQVISSADSVEGVKYDTIN